MTLVKRNRNVYYRLPFYGAAAYVVFTLIKLVFFTRGYAPDLVEIGFSMVAAVLIGYVGTIILMMVLVGALIPLSLVWGLFKSK